MTSSRPQLYYVRNHLKQEKNFDENMMFNSSVGIVPTNGLTHLGSRAYAGIVMNKTIYATDTCGVKSGSLEFNKHSRKCSSRDRFACWMSVIG